MEKAGKKAKFATKWRISPLRPLQRRICRTKVGTRTRQRRNQLHFKIRLGPGFLPLFRPLFRPLFCHPNHTAYYHRAIACTNNSHTKTKAMAPTTHHGSRRRPPTEPFQQHPGHEITPTGSQSPLLQMSIIGFFFSCLFSVGAPPTLLAAIRSELPTTVDDIMIMGVDWRSTWESAAETTPR